MDQIWSHFGVHLGTQNPSKTGYKNTTKNKTKNGPPSSRRQQESPRAGGMRWGPGREFRFGRSPALACVAVLRFFCPTRQSQSVQVCQISSEFFSRTPAHSAGPGGSLLPPGSWWSIFGFIFTDSIFIRKVELLSKEFQAQGGAVHKVLSSRLYQYTGYFRFWQALLMVRASVSMICSMNHVMKAHVSSPFLHYITSLHKRTDICLTYSSDAAVTSVS